MKLMVLFESILCDYCTNIVAVNIDSLFNSIMECDDYFYSDITENERNQINLEIINSNSK